MFARSAGRASERASERLCTITLAAAASTLWACKKRLESVEQNGKKLIGSFGPSPCSGQMEMEMEMEMQM